MKAILSKFTFRLRTSRLLQCCAAVLVLMALIGSYFLIQAALDPYDCRILDGVSLDGVGLGGMTRREARKTLQAAAQEALLTQPLSVALPRQTLTLDPKAIGLKLDVRKAVNDLYALGRKDDSGLAAEQGLSAYLRYDQEAICSAIQGYAAAYDTVLSQPQCRLEGTQPDLTEEGYDPAVPCPSLVLTLGTPEAHLNMEAALTEIVLFYDRAISAGRAGNYGLSIHVEPEQLPQEPDLGALYSQFAREAVDASPNMDTYEILPASYGLVFDLETAQAAVNAAGWGETVTIPMAYQTPEILSDGVYFRDVLGTCETKHTDDENRNTNLRLVCGILDGLILQPGEEFSYNGVVGERTEERGFKAAGAYSGTRLIKDIGGGVCQGSSTLYNCVLLADLEVTERVCHGYTVNYLPIGLDAAVNWATKTDFKFRNNFHFPIQIRAELDGGYMKMQILGTDEKDYYVEMRSGRSDEEHRIYSNSYKYKYSKETGELISKDLEARSSYMYFTG